MRFIINGTEYKLVFRHATFKRHLPPRLRAPEGLTGCTIFRRGKDHLEGKSSKGKQRTRETWVTRYSNVVLQTGAYNYTMGERKALTEALKALGWDRPVRKVVWCSYNNRSRISQYVPAINVPVVRSVTIAEVSRLAADRLGTLLAEHLKGKAAA